MADGGKAPTTAENTSEALAKPYMLVHPLSAEQVANLDEMLTILFDVDREQEITIAEVQEDVAAIDVTPADQVVLQKTINITEAQIESGNTSPPELVAAVADKVIVPLQALIVVTKTAAYSASPVWSLRHGSVSGNLTGTVTPTLTGAGTNTTRHVVGHLTTITYSADPTGKSLVLFLNADPSDPSTGVATAKVVLTYYLAEGIDSV